MKNWDEEIEDMALELRQVEEQCKKDGKSCENCGCIRFYGNKCIDLTCWRGFDGDHDGWIPDGQDSPNAKFQKLPNEVGDEDYKYNPFKDIKEAKNGKNSRRNYKSGK